MKREVVVAGAFLLHLSALTSRPRAEPPGGAPAPRVTTAICRPEFDTTEGRLDAGTAFVVRPRPQDRSFVLVTAHHLFGPDGGLSAQVKWSDLPSVVSAARCHQMTGPGRVLSAGPPLPVPNARIYSEEGPASDVAVFPLKDDKTPALELGSGTPPLKETVWLAARVAGGEAPDKLLHRATLVSVNQQWIEFAYDNPKLDLTATSGAPIVDGDGRVVGINIGAKVVGKKLVGVAQSAAVVRGAIDRALAAAARRGVATDSSSRHR